MSDTDKKRVIDLLRRLETLRDRRPAPGEDTTRDVAQQAIVDEISQLVRQGWLSVYRNGDTLDVVSLT